MSTTYCKISLRIGDFWLNLRNMKMKGQQLLLTYIQSRPLLTSYICHNFRHQQRMCHWQCTLLSLHSLPHTNAILGIFSDSHGSHLSLQFLCAFAFLKLIHDPCSTTTLDNSKKCQVTRQQVHWCVYSDPLNQSILCVWYEINHS